MNLFADLGQLARYVRDRIRHGRAPDSLRFDRERGVETAGWTLTYEPSPLDSLRDIFAALPFDPKHYTFCDLGCGKGRVLLLAAELPFAHIVGVEVEQGLFRTALQNVGTGSSRVEIFWMDASRFPLPAGPLALFLFNPFEGDILGSILARVGSDRPVFVIYLNPVHGGLLNNAGYTVADSGGEDATRWVIYQGGHPG